MPFSSICLLLFDLTTKNDRIWEKKEKTELQKKEKKETINFVKVTKSPNFSSKMLGFLPPVFNMEKSNFVYKHLL